MTPEQFADLFKQAIREGYLKVELTKDSFCDYQDITLEIKDKQDESIVTTSIYL